MNVVKLITGIVLIIVGGVLAIVAIIRLTRLEMDFSDAYHIGEFSGGLIVLVILIVISIFMIRFGARLTAKRN
jgi:hypothetical protein